MYFWAQNALASLKEERGQDLIEYALFGGLLATIIIAVAAAIISGAIDNPVETLLDGLGGCVDFNSGGCDPF
jgi:Flp pilus assembly pilin Flp